VASSQGSLSVDDVDDDETVVRLVRCPDDELADDVFGASVVVVVCAAIIDVAAAATVHGLLSTVSLTVLTVLFLNCATQTDKRPLKYTRIQLG